MVLTSCLFLLSTRHILVSPVQDNHILLNEDFNEGAKGQLAKKLLSHRHITLAKKAGPDGTDAIRVAYVGYERGSERVLLRYPLRSAVDRATFSFDVRFEKDFQWVRGGKLHGLGPKHAITGGKARHLDGWSARVTFKKDGHCATYLYDQDKDNKYGVGHKSIRPVFQAGKWHHVVFEVSLNTPGKPDGIARIIIDDKEAIKTKKVVFRGNGGRETQIQQFLFSTFHGGHEPHWSPIDKEGKPATVYAFFDNFRVIKGIQQDAATDADKTRR